MTGPPAGSARLPSLHIFSISHHRWLSATVIPASCKVRAAAAMKGPSPWPEGTVPVSCVLPRVFLGRARLTGSLRAAQAQDTLERGPTQTRKLP